MKSLPIGTEIELDDETVVIVNAVQHDARVFCNAEEGIGVEFGYIEYDANSTGNVFDDWTHTFRSHEIAG